MRIDSHQHFWIYDSARDSWINSSMKALRRNFLPNDIAPILRENNIDGVIAVQADQSHKETNFLVDLSIVYAMIKGVVGWVDLASEDVEKHLSGFSKYPIIKGFRHIVEGEKDGDFLMNRNIQRGIKALTKYGYTFDLLIRPKHYVSTLDCVENNPEQQFILDHIAKPRIKKKEFDDWAVFIEKLAKYPNVACKVSGLAREADWDNWKIDDFAPYLDHTIEQFGRQRIMFGSDWPVSLVAATYQENIEISGSRLHSFSTEDMAAFWGENARSIYKF